MKSKYCFLFLMMTGAIFSVNFTENLNTWPSDHPHYNWKEVIVQKGPLSESISKLTLGSKLVGKPVYVSLTTISDRIPTVHNTIEFIFKSAPVIPDHVFLILSEDPFLLDRGVQPERLPLELLKLSQIYPFTIVFTDNIGSHRKLLPLLSRKWNEDCIIITVDDDWGFLQAQTTIEIMLRLYLASGTTSVVAVRARRITFCDNSPYSIQPFETWPLAQVGVRELLVLPIGNYGILYRPTFFHSLIFDPKFRQLTIKQDDILFRLSTIAKLIPVVTACVFKGVKNATSECIPFPRINSSILEITQTFVTSQGFQTPPSRALLTKLPPTEAVSLFAFNGGSDANDRAFEHGSLYLYQRGVVNFTAVVEAFLPRERNMCEFNITTKKFRTKACGLISCTTEPNLLIKPIDWVRLTPATLRSGETGSYFASQEMQVFGEVLTNAVNFTLNGVVDILSAAFDPTPMILTDLSERSIRVFAARAEALAVSLRTGHYNLSIRIGAVQRYSARLVEALITSHRSTTLNGWGRSDHSPARATQVALAGWLLWGLLSPLSRARLQLLMMTEVRWVLSNRGMPSPPVLMDQSKRILSPGFSRSVECAGDAALIQACLAMMPHHPDASHLNQKLVQLSLLAHARPSDCDRVEEFLDKPLSTWLVAGSNLNDDYTAFNRHRISPDVMIGGLLEHTFLHWSGLSGQTFPACGRFNVREVYSVLADMKFSSWRDIHGRVVVEPGGTIFQKNSSSIFYPHDDNPGAIRLMHFALADVVASVLMTGELRERALLWQRRRAERALLLQNRFQDGRTFG